MTNFPTVKDRATKSGSLLQCGHFALARVSVAQPRQQVELVAGLGLVAELQQKRSQLQAVVGVVGVLRNEFGLRFQGALGLPLGRQRQRQAA